MENYVVRIYRRDSELNAVAGIVEIVDKQEEKPFKNHKELLAILKMVRVGASITWKDK